MLGALTRGRRHGQGTPGMGGVIGTCMTVTHQFNRQLLRIGAAAWLKTPHARVTEKGALLPHGS